MPSSRERQDATATYSAELQTVARHFVGTPEDGNPITLTKPDPATHLKLQAIDQNLRYTIDATDPSANVGFQLAAGTDVLIPCPNATILVAAEVVGGTYQGQWVY